MSDERDDLEMKALQRELDDAFETTRPRRGFEDELWLRLQQRRPFWNRLSDAFTGFTGAIRELPAVPTAAIASVVIVAIGLGVFAAGGGFHLGGANTYSATSAGRAPGTADLAAGGLLPTPVLRPGVVDPGVFASAPNGGVAFSPDLGAAAPNLYFGPAQLDWTGTFDTANVQAPVLAYVDPGLPQADQFAAAMGASASKQVRQVNGFIGTYAGDGFVVSVRGTVPELPREPYFVLTPSAPVAGSLLDKYSLVPPWPFLIYQTDAGGGRQRIVDGRYYPLPDGSFVHFINWNGDPDGIEVDLVNSQAVLAFGQLPLQLAPTSYRLISNAAAARAAVIAAPLGSAALNPTPVVHLDKALLVYALAVKNGRGYFEPAYLFSGSFQYNGQTYVKRVLVPLVDPSLRSS